VLLVLLYGPDGTSVRFLAVPSMTSIRADVPSGPYSRNEQHMNLQLRNAHPLECLPDNIIPFLISYTPSFSLTET